MAGKKTFLFIFFLLVSAMGVNMAEEETGKEKPVIFTASEEAETYITAAGAGKFAIKIKSNPTTGYSWSLQKPLDETMVKFKGIEIEERVAEKPPKLGAPTYEILTFEALGPGETVIYLQYRRPWEKSVPPIKSHKIVVSIK